MKVNQKVLLDDLEEVFTQDFGCCRLFLKIYKLKIQTCQVFAFLREFVEKLIKVIFIFELGEIQSQKLQ